MELQTGRFSKIDANLGEGDFKREWSHIEQAGVKYLLNEFIQEFYDEMGADAIADCESYFQLAFTSHGRFAELGVTTPQFTIDGNELNAFIIRNNNQLVAHCFDAEENDVFYEVQ